VDLVSLCVCGKDDISGRPYVCHDGRLMWDCPSKEIVELQTYQMPPIPMWSCLDDEWNIYSFSARNYIHIFFGRCATETNRCIKWRGGGSVCFSTRVTCLLGAYREVVPRFVCQGF
jgi:hypothetical protein